MEVALESVGEDLEDAFADKGDGGPKVDDE